MILKFIDAEDSNYELQIFKEKDLITFQTSNSITGTCDVSISKENLFDLIGALLTMQSKLKQNVTFDELIEKRNDEPRF